MTTFELVNGRTRETASLYDGPDAYIGAKRDADDWTALDPDAWFEVWALADDEPRTRVCLHYTTETIALFGSVSR